MTTPSTPPKSTRPRPRPKRKVVENGLFKSVPGTTFYADQAPRRKSLSVVTVSDGEPEVSITHVVRRHPDARNTTDDAGEQLNGNGDGGARRLEVEVRDGGRRRRDTESPLTPLPDEVILPPRRPTPPLYSPVIPSSAQSSGTARSPCWTDILGASSVRGGTDETEGGTDEVGLGGPVSADVMNDLWNAILPDTPVDDAVPDEDDEEDEEDEEDPVVRGIWDGLIPVGPKGPRGAPVIQEEISVVAESGPAQHIDSLPHLRITSPTLTPIPDPTPTQTVPNLPRPAAHDRHSSDANLFKRTRQDRIWDEVLPLSRDTDGPRPRASPVTQEDISVVEGTGSGVADIDEPDAPITPAPPTPTPVPVPAQGDPNLPRSAAHRQRLSAADISKADREARSIWHQVVPMSGEGPQGDPPATHDKDISVVDDPVSTAKDIDDHPDDHPDTPTIPPPPPPRPIPDPTPTQRLLDILLAAAHGRHVVDADDSEGIREAGIWDEVSLNGELKPRGSPVTGEKNIDDPQPDSPTTPPPPPTPTPNPAPVQTIDPDLPTAAAHLKQSLSDAEVGCFTRYMEQGVERGDGVGSLCARYQRHVSVSLLDADDLCAIWTSSNKSNGTSTPLLAHQSRLSPSSSRCNVCNGTSPALDASQSCHACLAVYARLPGAPGEFLRYVEERRGVVHAHEQALRA